MEYPMITRLYRVAIRVGDHYVTVEEQISLPTDATDEEITQAVALGRRIYHAQQAAIQEQIAAMPDAHPHLAPPPTSTAPPVILEPDAPATDRQRALIDRLARTLGWDATDLGRFAHEHQVAFATLTKGEASKLIDILKQIQPADPVERRSSYDEPTARSRQA